MNTSYKIFVNTDVFGRFCIRVILLKNNKSDLQVFQQRLYGIDKLFFGVEEGTISLYVYEGKHNIRFTVI